MDPREEIDRYMEDKRKEASQRPLNDGEIIAFFHRASKANLWRFPNPGNQMFKDLIVKGMSAENATKTVTRAREIIREVVSVDDSGSFGTGKSSPRSDSGETVDGAKHWWRNSSVRKVMSEGGQENLLDEVSKQIDWMDLWDKFKEATKDRKGERPWL